MGLFTDRASQALRFDEIEGRFDPWLLCIAIALAGLGVVMVASSSMPYAMNNGSGPFHYLGRHLVFLALGLVLALSLMRTEMKKIEHKASSAVALLRVAAGSVRAGVGRTVMVRVAGSTWVWPISRRSRQSS